MKKNRLVKINWILCLNLLVCFATSCQLKNCEIIVETNDTLTVRQLELQSDSCVRIYHYGEAAELLRNIVEHYAHVIDSAGLADYQNSIQFYGSLASVAPQVIHKPGDVLIPSYQNEVSHLMVPVQCGGKKDSFIFDTGANISTIARSTATTMGLNLIGSDITVGSSTSIEVTSQLAVADSIEVGGLLFEHVVFLVLPDEMMSFPSIGYEMHGIIGFPVISQMEEVRMNADGTIFVPFKPIDKGFRNMRFDGQNMIVQLLHEADTLQFFLDTGANFSELSKKYYDANEEAVRGSGTLREARRGGVGGMVTIEEYILPDFSYTIGNRCAVLEQIAVSLNDNHFDYDGTLGQDIFGQAEVMVLNFKHGYLDLQ